MKKQINTDFQGDIAKNNKNELPLFEDADCTILEGDQKNVESSSSKNATNLENNLKESTPFPNENNSSNISQLPKVDSDKEDLSRQATSGANVDSESKDSSQQATNGADTASDNETNKNCNLNKAKLDKIKNWYFGAIPFILVAIVISLFNIGKIRHPLSYLFLSLGLLELAITNFAISRKIAKACTCKNCKQQSNSSLKYAIFFGIATLGLLGLFIFFMVKK